MRGSIGLQARGLERCTQFCAVCVILAVVDTLGLGLPHQENGCAASGFLWVLSEWDDGHERH